MYKLNRIIAKFSIIGLLVALYSCNNISEVRKKAGRHFPENQIHFSASNAFYRTGLFYFSNKCLFENKKYRFNSHDEKMTLKNRRYQRFSLYDLDNKVNIIDGYWSYNNDTLLFQSYYNYQKNCFTDFPFMIKNCKEYYYKRKSCFVSKKFLFNDSRVMITLINKYFDTVMGDTIFVLRHNAFGSTFLHSITPVREIKISLKYGIVDFRNDDNSIFNFPY